MSIGLLLFKRRSKKDWASHRENCVSIQKYNKEFAGKVVDGSIDQNEQPELLRWYQANAARLGDVIHALVREYNTKHNPILDVNNTLFKTVVLRRNRQSGAVFFFSESNS